MPIRDTSLVVIRRLLLLPGRLHVISILVAVGLALTGAILSLFGLALPISSKLEMTGTWFFSS
jgi:hypothetical protein